MNRTVLYVTGFPPQLRAKDLAYEFERFGRLVRCDIPALKSASSSPFAFIEFRREDDAEDAYYDMHGRSIDGRRITVQWAKRPPSAAWRHEDSRRDQGRGGPRDDRYSGDRRSPPRRRSPSPRRDRDGGRDGDSRDGGRDGGRDSGRDSDRRDDRDDRDDRRRSASPARRSASPARRSPSPRRSASPRRSPSPAREAEEAAPALAQDEEDRDRRDD